MAKVKTARRPRKTNLTERQANTQQLSGPGDLVDTDQIGVQVGWLERLNRRHPQVGQ